MKLTICFLLVGATLYARATIKNSDTVDAALQTPLTDGIMGFGLEILLTKLEHLDHQMRELRLQMNALPEKMAGMQCFYEKTPPTQGHKIPPFTSCKNVPSKSSGVYFISVNNDSAPIKVYCEQEKFGGGWIVVQHRFDGSVNFYRNWTQYREVIEMKGFSGDYGFARYDGFQVGGEDEQYTLQTLGSYSGTAGDSLSDLNLWAKFSTYDRDNDLSPDEHFAVHYEAAWW
ncbi:ficolin-1-like [Anopheles aquasalis]|uniref:ficolin-1-like n=1 Tax=Anopheles aquasalis TaxID=42839 RepID=UPI00215AA21A|nr:ficolin-1-like [Anopheles aquasalis]